jgi:hypothetical protein
MTTYVSQCNGCSHNNQHDQSNQDPNQGFGYLLAPLKFYMVIKVFQDMASSSSSTSTNPLLAQPVTEKLTKLNHLLWHAQAKAAIRGTRLLGFLTGDFKASPSKIMQKDPNGKEVEVLNPEYEDWEATDQQVLSYLLSSLSKGDFDTNIIRNNNNLERDPRHVCIANKGMNRQYSVGPRKHPQRRYIGC